MWTALWNDLWTVRVKRIFGELSHKASSGRASSHFIDRLVDGINSWYLSSHSVRKFLRRSNCQALFNLAEILAFYSDAFTIRWGLSSAIFCWSTIHFSYRYENRLGTRTQIVHNIVWQTNIPYVQTEISNVKFMLVCLAYVTLTSVWFTILSIYIAFNVVQAENCLMLFSYRRTDWNCLATLSTSWLVTPELRSFLLFSLLRFIWAVLGI